MFFLFILGAYIIYIDCRHKIIAHKTIAFFGFNGMCYASQSLRLLSAFLSCGVMMMMIYIVRLMLLKWRSLYRQSCSEVLGGGDFKLFGCAPFYIFLNEWPVFFILCGIFGIISFFIYCHAIRQHDAVHFPFAPSIILSLWTCVLMRFLIEVNT